MQVVVNAGSSSLKWAIFSSASAQQSELRGSFERLGTPECTFHVSEKSQIVGELSISSALKFLADRLVSLRVAHPDEISSCVHRVVHGGEKYRSPVIVDESVKQDIDSLSVLAPLHNPSNLEGISACEELFSNAVNVAVFDTAFHTTISKEVFLYGIPYELYEKHKIRKYGFHGISHSYISDVLSDSLGHKPNAICAHLGSGSSITAIKDGMSADTTMGFTPVDGVLMATRSGKIDPEVPLFLLRQANVSVEGLETLLSKKSGLLGLTGHADLRDVWDAACSGDEKSQTALEMLCYDIAFYINALKTAVRNPEVLVFTAGIGERAWYIRQRVCEYLGVELDDQANKNNEYVISAEGSSLTVLVLHTDEQMQMHRLAADLLQDNQFKS